MVGFGKYTGIVDNLVRYILQLLMKFIHTDNRQVIINANIYLASMSVGKTRYPLQIIVLPNALVLYILILLIHIAKLTKNPEIHKSTIVNYIDIFIKYESF